jgi:hypothetical protein
VVVLELISKPIAVQSKLRFEEWHMLGTYATGEDEEGISRYDD